MAEAHDLANDLLRGMTRIAKFIGEPPRRGFYLAETGQIPAFKQGRLWMARKSTCVGTTNSLRRSTLTGRRARGEQ